MGEGQLRAKMEMESGKWGKRRRLGKGKNKNAEITERRARRASETARIRTYLVRQFRDRKWIWISARGRAAVYSNYLCCDKNDCDKEERIWLRTIGQFLRGTT